MPNVDLLEDACAALPHTTRSMFGGHGMFAPNGGMFAAVVDDDRLALKLPEESDQEAFRQVGAEPWVYDGKTTMRGWLVVPDELYDDPRALAEWARRAHATAKPGKKKGAKAVTKKAAPKKTPPKKAAAKRSVSRGRGA